MINKKKVSFNVEMFREILQFCPKIPGQEFEDLPFEQLKLATKRSKTQFHSSHASGSGVPIVTIYDSEIDIRVWGDSDEEDDDEDDFEDDADNNDDDSDHDDDSDDERTESDRDEIPDPNQTNDEQTEQEEEYVHERVDTPIYYQVTKEEKNDDKEKMDEENGNSFKPVPQTTTNADDSSTSLIPGLDKDAKICLLLYKNKILVVMKPTKKTQKIFEAKDKKLFQKNWVLERIVSMGVTQLVTRTNLSVECFNYTDGYFAKECRGPRNQDSRNKNQDSSRRTGYFHPPKFDLSNSGLEEFQQPEFEGYGPKTSKSVSEKFSKEVRESPDTSLVKKLVSDEILKKKTGSSTVTKIELAKGLSIYGLIDPTVGIKKPVLGGQRQQLKEIDWTKEFECLKPGDFAMMALTELIKMYWSMGLMQNLVQLGQDGLGVLNGAAKLMIHQCSSLDGLQIEKGSTVGSQAVLPQTVKKSAMINPKQTWRPKGNYLDSVNRGNGSYTLKQFEYGNPEEDLKDYAIIDSGCSGSMTGDKDKLSDFKEFKGGYVAFGNDSKGGRISGKGTIKTSCLDFEKVSYVEELKFNLLSVSQICDKKHNVLFTDKECLILSPKFKFVDEDLVILRAPRKNDVYSLDLKNIIPSGGITCLVAKATEDEAVLWHRRLGHVNFKNINKLVKGNLVRGLPSKTFKLDHSCLACRKGKQHRASCKKIEERTVREPLELLHMDLFWNLFQ
ncbi:putative ribonuclease H-like domain-containing protein [Tanacetum coccineum]